MLTDLQLSEATTPGPSAAPLIVTIRCYRDRRHDRWSHHDVTLHPDWSAQVPHDLDAEKVLVALGGYCSCIELVDRVLPAVRTYLLRQLRLELPWLSRDRRGHWRSADRVEGCCAWGATWPTAADAADHLRSARHVAAEHGARTAQVLTLGRMLLSERGLRDPVILRPDAARLTAYALLEPAAVAELWRAGLSPELVRAVHRRVATRPLPAGFFLGVLTKRPDLAWIRQTPQQAPEREVHKWLVWTETAEDRSQPTLRADWLAAGVSRRDIETLTRDGYTPADVSSLAARTGRSGVAAGALLARWVAAGCTPQVDDLVELHALRAPACERVNAASVNRLETELPGRHDRVRLAAAIALCGSPARAAVAVHDCGTTDPAALGLWVEQDDARAGAAHA